MAPPTTHSVAIQSVPNGNIGQLMETVDELVTTVPIQFRAHVRQACKELADRAEKSSHAAHALKSFETHKAKGTLPPAIKALRTPTIQVTDSFRKSNAYSERMNALEVCMKNTCDQLLDDAIELKKAEVKHYWDAYLNPTTAQSHLQSAVNDCYKQIVAIAGEGNEKALNTFVNEEKGKLDGLTGWYSGRAIQIGGARHHAHLLAKMKKLSVKEQTDSEMLDVDATTLQKAVENALKQRDRAEAQRKKSARSQPGTKKKTGIESCHLPTYPADQIPRQKTYWEGNETSQAQKALSRRQRQRNKETEEVIRLLEETPRRFRVKDAYSYPEFFSSACFAARAQYIILKSHVSWFDTLRRFSPGVHKGPDVFLSRDLEYFLSLNLKHVFHTKRDFSLPFEAYAHLERTVRIRCFFSDDDNDDFIPKFHIPSKKWDPPLAPHVIEQGLAAGKAELFSQLPAITPLNQRSKPRMNTARFFDELTDAKLLCFITDKNLGIAVVTVEWYDDKIREHLNSGPYVRSNPNPTVIFQELLKMDFSLLPEQLQKFLWGSKPGFRLPQFYGIPKIHKNPWQIRPIVPSHNWITAHLAKVLDHLLHPILKRLCPWVIESSREVAKYLHRLLDKPLDDVVLLKGDVKSMYTNIPRRAVIHVLQDMFAEFPTLCTRQLQRFIIDATRFINNHCFFEYQKEAYWQSDGLAMGSPCAPVLANLYMGWYERKARYVRGEVCYFRYIDDILAIVQRKVDSIPTQLQARVSAPGLTVEWERSVTSVSFLDLNICYINSRISTELYEKKLNHFQYIPWSSAHPRPVLKGFVKAELLRFLVASSYENGFSLARRSFWHHLRARGYPPYVLRRWFGQVSWNQRLHVLFRRKRDDEPVPLMLPSHYNSIWDQILIKRVHEAILKVWGQRKDELPPGLERKLVKSLSRTTSLFDCTRLWNREILGLIRPSEISSDSDTSDSLPFEELLPET